jgi:energy-coupling factor transporter ATP-binding protein EcfA2
MPMDSPIENDSDLSLPAEPPPLITWPCYEPAGRRVELTPADLLQHVLIIGATGSGKTTLVASALQQLVAHGAGDPSIKPGLLILDSKNELVGLVRATAQAAGRQSDVIVLGPDGNARFDLFGSLRSLEDVETVTRRMMLATPPLGGDNAYWQTATTSMLAAGLSLLVATQPYVTFDFALHFLRTWFMGARTIPKLLQDLVAKAKEQIPPAGKGSRKAQSHQLRGALDHVELWSQLDPRTRSNLQSCLLNVLRPLMSSAAATCFGQSSLPPFDPGLVARNGLLCVVSINVLTQPDLARFLFRLTRQAFFDAVQRRIGAQHRLCGLVADEFPLVVCRDDIEQLATVRSKGCFVLAATQGLAGIDDQIGERARRALVQHFNTVCFLRSLEEEAGRFAMLSLGLRREGASTSLSELVGGWLTLGQPRRATRLVPVCPPGELSRLAAHQAYALFRDGSRTEFPVWFAPWFEMQSSPDLLPPASSPGKPEPFTPQDVRRLLELAGASPLWAPEVLQAACEMCQPKQEPKSLLGEVIGFFGDKAGIVPEGLAELPGCWLVALPGILWSLRKEYWTRLPFVISKVGCRDGMLLLGFEKEQTPDTPDATVWDRIRAIVNRSVYPSLWRPLARRHRLALWRAHPELRAVLGGQDIDV